MPVLTLPRNDSLSVRAKAFVFEDEHSRALLSRIQQVAPSDATILLFGETGTGKEIVARHVHALSARCERPFVAVNCGALSATLVEGELFGHERGAFTGAMTAKPGWFEAADGGTLFLDEIGDLPLAMQVKLLRILQEREVVRLGARIATPVDVRLIAASNVRLEEAVLAGRFREDLYYRLNVAPLVLLPLRERTDDIVPLAEYFLALYGARLAIESPRLTEEASQLLLEHAWPGNIRELENVIHHALLVCLGGVVQPAHLRLTTLQPPSAAATGAARASGPAFERALLELFEAGLPNLYEEVQERLVRTAYQYCDRNQVHTARLLGVSRNIVRARLIQYGELGARATAPELERESVPPPSAAAAPARPLTTGAVRSARSRRWNLRIGYQHYGLLPLLKATGALERALQASGVQVEWREFPSGIQLIEALESDALGLGLVGEGPPIFAQAARIPIVYLAAEAPAPECEAIVVQADSAIRTVGELRHRTVMLSRGSNVHYFLILALEEAKLEYEDIQLVYVSPERALAMFESGRVDAWATWDPFLGSVCQAASARVLRDARGLTENTSYYIASRAFADQNPELVQVFLHEVNAVARWASQHGGEALQLLSDQTGKRSWNAAELVHLAARPIDSNHLASQQAVADAFLRHKLITRPVAVADAGWLHPLQRMPPAEHVRA